MSTSTGIQLSKEQQYFIDQALEGKNLLVDACIGSGKTTAIQNLCNQIPRNKRVLYLTYNRLLKMDAKQKIVKKNVLVTNYHGFAFIMLQRNGINVKSASDLVQAFLNNKPSIPKYDVLIIDEYQDIELELAQLVQFIKIVNPNIQIIAVGDMEQKIYDKTTLEVQPFMKSFLEEHEKLRFTLCFRLSSEIAAFLGRVWRKEIIGVNDNCKVESMSVKQVIPFLASQNLSDLLCLGARKGVMSDVLNALESYYPDKFNKDTVYASIRDNDSMGKVAVNSSSAIFTTYDSSKGLERKVCVIFDYTENYWMQRISMPQQDYAILRNVFCVAASRGKNRIIFVNADGEYMLREHTLSTPVRKNLSLKNMGVSSMFDFNYKEDVEKCFSLLKIEKQPQSDTSIIEVNSSDGLIDLSPCIGIYQEASYFKGYDIEKDIALKILLSPGLKNLYTDVIRDKSLDEKVLFLTYLDTGLERYKTQVSVPFVSEEQRKLISERLSSRLSDNEKVQVECKIDFSDRYYGDIRFSAKGIADVVKDDTVYELKFVSDLTHEHFLQCACYVVALSLKKGILWNVHNNTSYSIEVPDKKEFLDAVTKSITKGLFSKYYRPANDATYKPL